MISVTETGEWQQTGIGDILLLLFYYNNTYKQKPAELAVHTNLIHF